MTMARAKRRAVSASTEAIAAPSRRCRCQSSGRLSVSWSIGPNFTWRARAPCDTARLRGAPVMRAASFAASLGGERLEQHVEHAVGVQAPAAVSRRRARAPARTRPAGGAARRRARPRASPSGRRATSSNFLVSSRAMSDLALVAEARAQVRQRRGDAVRRLVEDHRPGQLERLAAPCGARAAGRGQEAGEQEAGRRRSPPTENAAAAALGPGSGLTRMPARCASATSSAPGSDSAGVPASLTSATSCLRAARRSACRGARARCARAGRRCASRCRSARAACAWCACPRRRSGRAERSASSGARARIGEVADRGGDDVAGCRRSWSTAVAAQCPLSLP